MTLENVIEKVQMAFSKFVDLEAAYNYTDPRLFSLVFHGLSPDSTRHCGLSFEGFAYLVVFTFYHLFQSVNNNFIANCRWDIHDARAHDNVLDVLLHIQKL